MKLTAQIIKNYFYDWEYLKSTINRIKQVLSRNLQMKN